MSNLDELKQLRPSLDGAIITTTDAKRASVVLQINMVRNLIAAIDWAIQQIERPADAEIDKTIEEFAQASDRSHYSQDNGHVKTPISLSSIDLAIQALLQYRPLSTPADAAIDKAIEYFSNLTERISQTLDNRNANGQPIHGYEEQRNCYNLAIRALRQMRGEA